MLNHFVFISNRNVAPGITVLCFEKQPHLLKDTPFAIVMAEAMEAMALCFM